MGYGISIRIEAPFAEGAAACATRSRPRASAC